MIHDIHNPKNDTLPVGFNEPYGIRIVDNAYAEIKNNNENYKIGQSHAGFVKCSTCIYVSSSKACKITNNYINGWGGGGGIAQGRGNMQGC